MIFDKICYHCYTTWLFIKGDIPSFIIPGCLFGLSGALSGTLTASDGSHGPTVSHVLCNLPKVVLFAVLDCLVFDIANQSIPGAVEEDMLNKPWRPIPARRLTKPAARRLMLVVIPVALWTSYLLGVYTETATLFVLSWMYNDLGGGDMLWVRNLVLFVVYFLYNQGSLRLASGAGTTINSSGQLWTLIVSCIIFTTLHLQDMKDQLGDAKRGRSTLPLVIGDFKARYAIAVPLMFWTVFCPMFWGCGRFSLLGSVVCGTHVSLRLLLLRNVEADKKTYNLWALWLAIAYSMPILSAL